VLLSHSFSFTHSPYLSLSLYSARSITGIKFTCDGRTILTVATSRRVTVVDVERGDQILCYENCAFNGKDRVPLVTDPSCPYLAICSGVNGKGFTLLDLRMPIPFDCVYDVSTPFTLFSNSFAT